MEKELQQVSRARREYFHLLAVRTCAVWYFRSPCFINGKMDLLNTKITELFVSYISNFQTLGRLLVLTENT